MHSPGNDDNEQYAANRWGYYINHTGIDQLFLSIGMIFLYIQITAPSPIGLPAF